jgi:glutamyl-Q tRNA(Asp) synthetase
MAKSRENSTAVPAEYEFYRGRFAPSPTGPLHFGSLVAAVASYADALHHNGEWLLRIDDVDEARAKSNAVELILKTLEFLGFEWSGTPVFQTDRIELYRSIINELLIKNRAFHCGCTRKEVDTAEQHASTSSIYPGTCRNGLPTGKKRRSIRLRVENREVNFIDRFAGPIRQNVSDEIGDFIIQRADGFVAYQLAVVVDDYIENITHILRGADLLSSTPRQIYLQEQLGFPCPIYGHIPLVIDQFGKKLSKNDGAPYLSSEHPNSQLLAAWKFLGQTLPDDHTETVSEFWCHARSTWNPSNMPVSVQHI